MRPWGWSGPMAGRTQGAAGPPRTAWSGPGVIGTREHVMAEGVVTLWGDEHTVLDQVADVAVDGRTAVALSRGRYPKPYEHLDPNEDGVLAACGPAGRLLAVVDGHFGFDAARAALAAVADRAPTLVEQAPRRPAAALQDVCGAALRAVAAAVAAATGAREDSRTALTLALLVGDFLYVATYGDTVCVRERSGRGKAVGADAAFLGPDSDIAPVTRVRLRPQDRVAVASDGLTTYLGRDWVGHTAAILARAEDPRWAARALVELAMDGGAGDHVAVGVLA